MLAGVPILGEQFNMKKIQQSISQAWKTIVSNDPEHVIVHPVFLSIGMIKPLKPFGSSALMWQDGKITEDAL